MSLLASNPNILMKHVELLLYIGGGVFYSVCLIYGCFLLMTAKGEKKRHARGIKMFKNVAISLILLAILLGALYGLIAIF